MRNGKSTETEKLAEMKKFGLACYSETFSYALTLAVDRKCGVEIQTFTEPAVLTGDWKSLLVEYRKKFEETPPEFVTFHAPYVDIAPLVTDPFIKEAVVRRMEWSFDSARELNAEGVIVHLCTPLRKIDHNLDLWIERQLEFWKPFVDRVEKEETCLYLENSYEPDPAFLAFLCDRLDSDRVKICFDVGHVDILSGGSVNEWLAAAGDRISYLHLHNNDGHEDLHASLGDGRLDFRTLLPKFSETVDQNTTSIIEVDSVTDLVASLKYLDEIGWWPTDRDQKKAVTGP